MLTANIFTLLVPLLQDFMCHTCLVLYVDIHNIAFNFGNVGSDLRKEEIEHLVIQLIRERVFVRSLTL